jgi:hypothetical protein
MSGAERELPTVLVAPPAARTAGRLGIPEVYAGIALLSFLVARFVPVLQLHYPCPFLFFTGHPCGTCGMTHAFVYLAHGHVLQALRWSPLGALLAASAWAYALADLIRLAAGQPFPVPAPERLRRWVLAGAVAMLVNWAYLLLHGLGP